MPDTKITALTANTSPIATDIMPMVDDPGGTPATQKITMADLQSLMAAGMYPGGRLTLTTATPVTTADVTGATTLYYTPYIHDNIRLYDGATWRTVAFTEKSITLVGTTASKPYDVFGYLSGGTLALELLIWTNATTRATALTYQNGRLVKTGAETRLYLGTIYVNSSGGQTDSSVSKRFVWNYYNRVRRVLYMAEATQHNYNSTTIRSWNNDATQITQFIVGVVEDPIILNLWSDQWTGAGWAGLGYDATNAIISTVNYPINSHTGTDAGERWSQMTSFTHYPTAGYHYYSAVEKADSGTVTFDKYFQNHIIMG